MWCEVFPIITACLFGNDKISVAVVPWCFSSDGNTTNLRRRDKVKTDWLCQIWVIIIILIIILFVSAARETNSLCRPASIVAGYTFALIVPNTLAFNKP